MRVGSATWLATYLFATACSVNPDTLPEDSEDGFVVDDDKADNFLSLKAQEFILTGTSTVVVEDGKGIDRAKQLVFEKHLAITWFLNNYLVDKDHDPADPDANANYGGFAAMVKNGAYDDLALTQVNATTWSFKFTQTIAGKKNLMSKLPLDSHGAFTVEIGKPTNAEMESGDEWYRQPPWDAWDPSKVTADKKETLTLTIRPDKTSTDAWWDYRRLFEDNALTIDAHFGWDYNTEQAHLHDSKAFYTWLLDRGFRSPTSSWDAYNRTSGPLTKTLDANGHPVQVEVRIFYPRPGTSTDPETAAGGKQLEKDMFASLKSSDVIVYSGHSGPLYGFALADWNKTDEGDVDDTELAVTPLAQGRYQIVLAEGCNTYMLGNTLLQNPTKQGKDIDVITTTSFSVSSTPVEDFVGRMLELDSQSRHRPRTMSQTLEDLDRYSIGESSPTMYGVHGIDDDPKLHPYSNPENSCKQCSANAECGGVGNACVTVGHSGRRCVPACTADAGCPTGSLCKPVASAATNTIYGSYCVPATHTCN
jgi:hypothetical protein